ncbi:hypothetical protein BC829DRAFT_388001 [Chytridium lagenaria]|nr:hypothetical protein BC829DRAFT_388001 [Chytridium lagenaria]
MFRQDVMYTEEIKDIVLGFVSNLIEKSAHYNNNFLSLQALILVLLERIQSQQLPKDYADTLFSHCTKYMDALSTRCNVAAFISKSEGPRKPPTTCAVGTVPEVVEWLAEVDMRESECFELAFMVTMEMMDHFCREGEKVAARVLIVAAEEDGVEVWVNRRVEGVNSVLVKAGRRVKVGVAYVVMMDWKMRMQIKKEETMGLVQSITSQQLCKHVEVDPLFQSSLSSLTSLKCFDLIAWMTNTSHRGPTFPCPICSVDLTITAIRLDLWYLSLLNMVTAARVQVGDDGRLCGVVMSARF